MADVATVSHRLRTSVLVPKFPLLPYPRNCLSFLIVCVDRLPSACFAFICIIIRDGDYYWYDTGNLIIVSRVLGLCVSGLEMSPRGKLDSHEGSS